MTLEELKKRQSWTFDQKLDHAVATAENFFSRLDTLCKNDTIFILSFSLNYANFLFHSCFYFFFSIFAVN